MQECTFEEFQAYSKKTCKELANIINDRTDTELRQTIFNRNIKASISSCKKNTMIFDALFDLDFKEAKYLNEFWESRSIKTFIQSRNKAWNNSNTELMKKYMAFVYTLENEIYKSKSQIQGTNVCLGDLTQDMYNYGGNFPVKSKYTKVTLQINWLNALYTLGYHFIRIIRKRETSSSSFVSRFISEWKFYKSKTENSNDTERDYIENPYDNTICWKRYSLFKIKENLTFENRTEISNALFTRNLDKILFQASGCIYSGFRMPNRLEFSCIDSSQVYREHVNFTLYEVPFESFVSFSLSNWRMHKIETYNFDGTPVEQIKKTYSGKLPGYTYENGVYTLRQQTQVIKGFDSKIAIKNIINKYQIYARRPIVNRQIVLSDYANNQFDKYYATAQDLQECPICLDSIQKNSQKCWTACGHLFHKDCLVKCLQVKNECPICKFK